MREARPTVRDLSKLVRTEGSSNDLTDLLRTAPGLARVAEPALEHSREALREAVPNFTFSRPYGPELIAWLRDFGLTAGNYDANGHYARVAPAFMSHAFTDTPAGRRAASGPARAALRRLHQARGAPLPRQRHAAGERRLLAVHRRRHERLRPQPGAARAMRRVLAIGAVLLAAVVLAVVATGADEGDDGAYRVRAIFMNASFLVDSVDVKVAGVKVGTGRVARRHAPTTGRRSCC